MRLINSLVIKYAIAKPLIPLPFLYTLVAKEWINLKLFNLVVISCVNHVSQIQIMSFLPTLSYNSRAITWLWTFQKNIFTFNISHLFTIVELRRLLLGVTSFSTSAWFWSCPVECARFLSPYRCFWKGWWGDVRRVEVSFLIIFN